MIYLCLLNGLSSKFSSLNADFYTMYFSGPNYCNLKTLWCFPQCWVCDCLPEEERGHTQGMSIYPVFQKTSFFYIKVLIIMQTLGFHYFKHNFALLVSSWSSPRQNPFLIPFVTFMQHVQQSPSSFFLLPSGSSSKAYIFTHPIPSDRHCKPGYTKENHTALAESFLITYVSTSLFYKWIKVDCVYVHHTLVIYSPSDVHLGTFHLLTPRSRAAVNIKS